MINIKTPKLVCGITQFILKILKSWMQTTLESSGTAMMAYALMSVCKWFCNRKRNTRITD